MRYAARLARRMDEIFFDLTGVAFPLRLIDWKFILPEPFCITLLIKAD